MARSKKRKNIDVAVGCLILIMLFLIIMPSPYKPTDQSIGEVKGLTEYITSHYSFPRKSLFDSKSAPISWVAGRNICFFKEPHVITVCYITSAKEQDKIIDLIATYKKEHRIRTVTVQFYDAEYQRIKQVEYGEVTSCGVEGFLSEREVR